MPNVSILLGVSASGSWLSTIILVRNQEISFEAKYLILHDLCSSEADRILWADAIALTSTTSSKREAKFSKWGIYIYIVLLSESFLVYADRRT